MTFSRGLGVLLLASWMPFTSALGAPTPSFVDPVARLEYGQARGRPQLILRVDGLDAQGLADEGLLGAVRDLAAPAELPNVAKVEAMELSPAGASSRTWVVVLDVSGAPANTTQPRWLQLVLCGQDVVLPYTLTNAAAVPFTWTVAARPVISIASGEAIPVSVTVGPVPARGVTVLDSALVEKVSRALLAPKGLSLCRSPEHPCSAPVEGLPANTSAQLWLVGASEVGVFEGAVRLAAIEKPAGDAVALTVNSSTGWRRLLGVMVILVAVVLAWAGTVFVRHRINRAQLELPAALTRRALQELADFVKTELAGAPAHNVTAKLKELLGNLETSVLQEHGLPGGVPELSISPASLEAYRAHVKAVNDWAVVLGVLIHLGLTEAWEVHQGAAPGTDEAKAAHDAFMAIDGLVQLGVSTPPLDVQPRQDAILAQLRAAPGRLKRLERAAASPVSPPSPDEVRVSIAWLGLAGWAIVLLATVLSGAYILVLGPNAQGFGTPLDFLVCALWGLGLPAGAQLLQSTTTSVATTFGVPKQVP